MSADFSPARRADFIESGDGGFCQLFVLDALRFDDLGGNAVHVHHWRHERLVQQGHSGEMGARELGVEGGSRGNREIPCGVARIAD